MQLCDSGGLLDDKVGLFASVDLCGRAALLATVRGTRANCRLGFTPDCSVSNENTAAGYFGSSESAFTTSGRMAGFMRIEKHLDSLGQSGKLRLADRCRG